MLNKEHAIQSIVLLLLGFNPDEYYITLEGSILSLDGDVECLGGESAELINTMYRTLQQASDEKIMILGSIIRRFN